MHTIFSAPGQAEQLDVGLSAKGKAACEYARRGWFVFPLVPDQKEPLSDLAPRGQSDATTDIDRITRWWTAAPEANIGLHLAPSGLVAVDADTYKGEVTTAGELPPTLTQRSARGGTHMIYTAEDGARYGRHRSVNIDVKHRGYIVVAPSTFEGKPYMWANLDAPQPAPQWLRKPERTKADPNARGTTGRTLDEAAEALGYINPDIPYDDWLAVLMGLHDEFGDEAIQIADDWSAKGHKYRDGMVDDKFRTFERGDGSTINTVFHLAREQGCDLSALHAKHQQDVMALFQVVPESERAKSIFEQIAEQDKENQRQDVYPLLLPAALKARKPPEFLIARHIPQNSLGFLYSAPGVGKSFMAQDIGLHIAYGLTDWHGDAIQPSGDGSVIYIASEGSFDLPLRIEAWKAAHDIEDDTDRFLILESSVNFMHAEDVAKLVRSIHAVNRQPALIVVDTVSRALPGADENLQKDMTLFIQACDRIREAFHCAVMGLHHASKGGTIRGSSVIEGAGDFILHMDRDKGAQVGTLTMFKQKAAADGWSYPFTLKEQVLPKAFFGDQPEGALASEGAVGKSHNWSSLVFHRADPEALAAVAEVGHNTGAVLNAIERAWLDGKPWSKEPRAKGRYAVALMGDQFSIPKLEAKALLDKWLADGVLTNDIQNTDSKRPGLRVIRMSNVNTDDDVFG